MFKEQKLNSIRMEMERVLQQPISQYKKNVRLAELMSMMEQYFDIPLVDVDAFNELDPDIRTLYLDLSNARKLD